MAKYLKKFVYIFIGLLVLTGIAVIQFIPQNTYDSIIINDDSGLKNPQINPPPPTPFVVGTGNSPLDLDPHDAYDSTSFDTIDQVCEGLFTYDLADPGLPRINFLAESYWWQDDTTLLLKLREGVTFHDGTFSKFKK